MSPLRGTVTRITSSASSNKKALDSRSSKRRVFAATHALRKESSAFNSSNSGFIIVLPQENGSKVQKHKADIHVPHPTTARSTSSATPPHGVMLLSLMTRGFSIKVLAWICVKGLYTALGAKVIVLSVMLCYPVRCLWIDIHSTYRIFTHFSSPN